MIAPKEIYSIIESHIEWRTRLKNMVASGVITMSVDEISCDSSCLFGQMLYGDRFGAEVKETKMFKNIVAVHSDFHKVCGRVATLVVAKDFAGAQTLYDWDTNVLSLSLIRHLLDWQKNLGDK